MLNLCLLRVGVGRNTVGQSLSCCGSGAQGGSTIPQVGNKRTGAERGMMQDAEAVVGWRAQGGQDDERRRLLGVDDAALAVLCYCGRGDAQQSAPQDRRRPECVGVCGGRGHVNCWRA